MTTFGAETPTNDDILTGAVTPPVEHPTLEPPPDNVDPEPEIVENPVTPGNTIALAQSVDVSRVEESWAHDWLHFKGDKLAIRTPSQQALAAFALSSGKYIPIEVKNDLTSLFMANHLSPESYGRVFTRLMNPDDPDYDIDTVGDLFEAIVNTTAEKAKAEAEAEKAKTAIAAPA